MTGKLDEISSSNDGLQGGTILALNPRGYGPPVLVPCPCRACAVLRARNERPVN